MRLFVIWKEVLYLVYQFWDNVIVLMGEEMVIGEVFCKIFFIIGLEFFMYGILVFSFFDRKYCFYGLDIDIILELCGIFWEFCCDNGSCVCIVLFGKCFGKMDVNCEL